MELSQELIAMPLFTNSQINSKPCVILIILGRVSLELLQEIFKEMVEHGSAEWLTLNQKALLFWKKPPEWADLIYSYAVDSGFTGGTIMTAYELFHGADNQHTEFTQLPESMWRRSIRLLEKQGKAKLFEAEEGAANSLETGIKFF